LESGQASGRAAPGPEAQARTGKAAQAETVATAGKPSRPDRTGAAGSGPTGSLSGSGPQPAGMGAIVHLGAGTGAALPSYLASGAGRIVLVEPEPDRAADLRALVAALPEPEAARVRVIEAAVAETDGTALLTVYNQPDASSLVSPTGLTEVYPGLRRIARVEVATISPATLWRRIALVPGLRHRLIVEVPGMEAFVLQALAGLRAPLNAPVDPAGPAGLAGLADPAALPVPDGLLAFEQIDLACGTEPLYEGAVPARQLVGWLQERGYVAAPEDPEADPDFRRVVLRQNPMLPQLRAVEAARDRLTADLQAEREAARRAAEAATAEADRRIWRPPAPRPPLPPKLPPLGRRRRKPKPPARPPPVPKPRPGWLPPKPVWPKPKPGWQRRRPGWPGPRPP
jgi:FkbM family methyltransferase